MKQFRLVGYSVKDGKEIIGDWNNMKSFEVKGLFEKIQEVVNQGIEKDTWYMEFKDEYKETEGFYKVKTTGFSITIDTFYNPETKEEVEHMTWDIDDDRVEYAMRDWRDCPSVIDELDSPIYREWAHKHKRALLGDKVIISRGRKFKGEIKQIKGEFTYVVDGTYGKGDVDYWTFTDGTKVAKYNCDLYLGV